MGKRRIEYYDPKAIRMQEKALDNSICNNINNSRDGLYTDKVSHQVKSNDRDRK